MGAIDLPPLPALHGRARTRIDLSNYGAVISTGGFRPDFRSWLPWPDAFDDGGFALQTDGKSDSVDGLWFVGLHFLRKRISALLAGVGEDAGVLHPAGPRWPADVVRYNDIAKKIMKEHGAAIDDLYGFVLPKVATIQLPVNVHFKPAGSQALAEEVARHLRGALAE